MLVYCQRLPVWRQQTVFRPRLVAAWASWLFFIIIQTRLGSVDTGCGSARHVGRPSGRAVGVAVGETVNLLHPPLHLVGVSLMMRRGCQQNDSLADG